MTVTSDVVDLINIQDSRFKFDEKYKTIIYTRAQAIRYMFFSKRAIYLPFMYGYKDFNVSLPLIISDEF